jgi:FMN phosphatase YigB (HAD superfamily)
MSIELLGKKVDAFVFDVDGTFYEQKVLKAVFDSVQLQIARRILQFQGNHNPKQTEIDSMRLGYVKLAEESGSFSGAYVKYGGTVEEFKLTVETVDRSRFLQFDPELAELLCYLKKLVKVGLFTSTIEKTTHNTCTALLGSNWREYFDVVLCCDTTGVSVEKPQKEAFEYILNLLGVSAENAVMVGDVPGADLIPAATLGMLTIQVGRSDHQDALLYLDTVHNLVRHLVVDQ